MSNLRNMQDCRIPTSGPRKVIFHISEIAHGAFGEVHEVSP